MGYGYRETCRELFKELKILTLSSQYIFSLLLFVVNNKNYFVSNSVYHNINKVNTIPLQAWTGPEGSRRMSFPDFKTIST